MFPLVTGIVFLLIGIALGAGGVWLAMLGGSWYYVIAGLGFVLTGALLAARQRVSLWVYALVVLGTLAWTLWEVGLDWWQIAPRGGVVFLLGLWLLLPWVSRPMRRRPDGGAGGARIPLALALLLFAGVSVVAAFTPTHGREGAVAQAPGAAPPPDVVGVPAGEWHAYGRTGYGDRYSPLEQITPQNIGGLEVAWTYQTGDLRRPDDPNETTYEVTPLKIEDTVYLCTPHNLVIALDAATGEERWRVDPQVPDESNRQHLTCRGVSYYQAAEETPPAECPQRIFMPTADARLIALDAETGEICQGFGEQGEVDLWANMPNVTDGFYYSTSPPVVAGGLIVVGGAVNDNVSVNEPSGVIRAYDAMTGELVWNWDPANPGDTTPIAAGETYSENSPNMWSTASVDEALGMVYLPMGNAPPDQWGGNRSETDERYSTTIVALDLETGQEQWVFQAVHHDLWDMDVPAQPTLVDLQTDAGVVPALVAPTKQGDVFVLDRRNGEPLLPVTELPAPTGAAEGDVAAPTQPMSALSFRPDPLQGRDMWGVTLFDQLACRIRLHSLRYEGIYTPPSEQGSIIYPGNFGVFNWGGVAVDPRRQVLIGTPAYLAFVSTLIAREDDQTNYVSQGEPGLNENYGAPFAVDMRPFLSPLGLPCQAPPWGYIAAADLRTGEIIWMHRNGTVRDLAPLPLPFEMGVPDLGGPLVTAGGVAFASGTLDYFVRGYDVTTGRMLWQDRLPAGGQATPMSYQAGGRQYVLVVAGGHGSIGTKAGDSIIAYALR